MTRTLHGHPLSGNTHKVRLLLGFLNLDYDEIAIDVPGGQQQQPEFLAINPIGQVPVLTDEDGTRIHDSQAILLYLGARYASGSWWPQSASEQGMVAQWLSFAANEVQNGLNLARLHFLLGLPVNLDAAQALGSRSLALLNQHLSGQEWLEAGRPTVADCAIFPYVALAPEGKVMVEDYPAVLRWMQRFRELPGFSAMPSI